jgi:hypothetical protein
MIEVRQGKCYKVTYTYKFGQTDLTDTVIVICHSDHNANDVANLIKEEGEKYNKQRNSGDPGPMSDYRFSEFRLILENCKCLVEE